eukprot:2090538-Alexandrium_andersonii.AAC.1
MSKCSNAVVVSNWGWDARCTAPPGTSFGLETLRLFADSRPGLGRSGPGMPDARRLQGHGSDLRPSDCSPVPGLA